VVIYPIKDPFALERDSDYYYEIIKDGNVAGDNGNWALFVNGDNLDVCVKVSGSWAISFKIERPP